MIKNLLAMRATHPEFKSRPDMPHPLFSGLIKAALEQKGSDDNERSSM